MKIFPWVCLRWELVKSICTLKYCWLTAEFYMDSILKLWVAKLLNSLKHFLLQGKRCFEHWLLSTTMKSNYLSAWFSRIDHIQEVVRLLNWVQILKDIVHINWDFHSSWLMYFCCPDNHSWHLNKIPLRTKMEGPEQPSESCTSYFPGDFLSTPVVCTP